jgi:hypothetical protein
LLKRERIDGVLRDGLGGSEIVNRGAFGFYWMGHGKGLRAALDVMMKKWRPWHMDCYFFWLVVEALYSWSRSISYRFLQ